MKEYLRLLGENACYDEQYCQIALGQVKTHRIKAASTTSNKKRIEANINGNFNNTEFINLIRDMMLEHTEELDELLDL